MPQSQIPNTEDAQIGDRLKALRTERDLSLRLLAERSRLNINTISMWENNKSSPTVGNLQQLARALGVPLGSFFEPENEPRPIVFTRADSRLEKVAGGMKIRPLGKGMRSGAVEAFIVMLEPGAANRENWIVHTGYEVVYCLKGSIHYHFENEMHTLQEGDSLMFEAHIKHHWHVASEGASIMMVLVPLDPFESPAQRHFTD